MSNRIYLYRHKKNLLAFGEGVSVGGECHKLPLYPYQNFMCKKIDTVPIMWIIALEHSTIGNTMTDRKDIEELADRVADDLHITDVYAVYEIGNIINEHRNEIDLSDYNAVLEFVTDVLDDDIII